MKQSFLAAVFAVLVIAVFLTFRYNESAKAQAQTVAATPAAMMTGHAGTSECPYAHTSAMKSGECPYSAACANGDACPHAGSAGMSATPAQASIVPVMEKTSSKSGGDCPPCPACPAGKTCSGHHTMAGK